MLEQFERGSRDPGDQERLIRRVDVALPVRFCEFLGREPRCIKVSAGLNDFSAKGLG